MARRSERSKKSVLGAGRRLRLIREGRWEFVERVNATGVVAIIALTADDQVILTEQFRQPVEARVIDLPAGLVSDDEGNEAAATAARRELIEETGFDSRRFDFLVQAPTSPGLTSEVVSFFRAAKAAKVAEGGGVDGEKIVVHLVSLTTADAWLRRQIRRGTQVDCKVYVGLYLARQNWPRQRPKT